MSTTAHFFVTVFFYNHFLEILRRRRGHSKNLPVNPPAVFLTKFNRAPCSSWRHGVRVRRRRAQAPPAAARGRVKPGDGACRISSLAHEPQRRVIYYPVAATVTICVEISALLGPGISYRDLTFPQLWLLFPYPSRTLGGG